MDFSPESQVMFSGKNNREYETGDAEKCFNLLYLICIIQSRASSLEMTLLG